MSDLRERLQSALAPRYTIEKEIGRGGMASVFLASDVKHGRRVALKVLHPALAAALGSERFLREIATTASLQHPHILTVHDSGDVDGLVYYTMPFVDGESLRERMTREEELPTLAVVRILREVIEALAYAHHLGIVHRDIKPENIMLSGRHAWLMDFGIAKAMSDTLTIEGLTAMGDIIGTPAYMAPEQAASGGDVDHRADIYAIGVVAYELLAGRAPFRGTSQQILAGARHTNRTPVAVPAPRHSPCARRCRHAVPREAAGRSMAERGRAAAAPGRDGDRQGAGKSRPVESADRADVRAHRGRVPPAGPREPRSAHDRRRDDVPGQQRRLRHAGVLSARHGTRSAGLRRHPRRISVSERRPDAVRMRTERPPAGEPAARRSHDAPPRAPWGSRRSRAPGGDHCCRVLGGWGPGARAAQPCGVSQTDRGWRADARLQSQSRDLLCDASAHGDDVGRPCGAAGTAPRRR